MMKNEKNNKINTRKKENPMNDIKKCVKRW